MALPQPARNMRWNEETERKLQEIVDYFQPFCTNRSQAVRLLIDLFYVAVSNPAILQAWVASIQGEHRNILFRSVRTNAEKPGPEKLAQSSLWAGQGGGE